MLQAIIFLLISIFCEVFATTSLKLSDGFTKFWPTASLIIGYLLAFYFMSLSTKVLPISIVYVVWSGLGSVLISIVGYYFFKESFDMIKIAGLCFILFGVFIMKYSTFFTKD